MSDASHTSEVSLKKEGQIPSDEENCSSAKELPGIAGTQERSPVLDYLESPSQDLHGSFYCLSQGLTLGSSWHGCEFQLVPSTMDTLLFGLSENEQTLNSVALCIDLSGQEDVFLKFRARMTLMLAERR